MKELIDKSEYIHTMHDKHVQHMAMAALEECTALCNSIFTSSLRFWEAKAQAAESAINTENGIFGLEGARVDDVESAEQVCDLKQQLFTIPKRLR